MNSFSFASLLSGGRLLRPKTAVHVHVRPQRLSREIEEEERIKAFGNTSKFNNRETDLHQRNVSDIGSSLPNLCKAGAIPLDDPTGKDMYTAIRETNCSERAEYQDISGQVHPPSPDTIRQSSKEKIVRFSEANDTIHIVSMDADSVQARMLSEDVMYRFLTQCADLNEDDDDDDEEIAAQAPGTQKYTINSIWNNVTLSCANSNVCS